jgi:hypothetical protein
LPVFAPLRVVAAPSGGVFVLDRDRVWLWRDGRLRPYAGDGKRGLAGDGGPAARARLDALRDIAVDATGRLYVADTGNGRVRRVGADGTIETVVGAAAPPRCVERGLDEPLALDPRRCLGVGALAVDPAGDVYLATRGAPSILALTPPGRLVRVAGTGVAGWNGDGGPAPAARLVGVRALAFHEGDLYLAAGAGPVERLHDPLAGARSGPSGPQAPAAGRACGAIADVRRAEVGFRLDEERPASVRASEQRLEAALRSLVRVAPLQRGGRRRCSGTCT